MTNSHLTKSSHLYAIFSHIYIFFSTSVFTNYLDRQRLVSAIVGQYLSRENKLALCLKKNNYSLASTDGTHKGEKPSTFSQQRYGR